MSVTRDSQSGRYLPSSTAEWAEFILTTGLGISNPNGLWLCQDSGTPAFINDSIGTVNLTGTSINYQQSIPGWNRFGVTWLDTGGATAINLTDPSLPDLNTTSMAVLALVRIYNVPAAERSVLNIGPGGTHANNVSVEVNTSRFFVITDGTNAGTGAVDDGTIVVPILLLYNKTAGTSAIFAALEKITKTFVTPAAASKGIWVGSTYASTPTMALLYMAAWYGAGAEMTDTQAVALLKAMRNGPPQTFHATGTYTGPSTSDVTSQASWTTSDTTIFTIGGSTATGSVQNAGYIWGSTVGVTATIGAIAGTGTVIVPSSDNTSSFGLVHMPQQDSHWQALGLSPWGHYWGLQEPTGSAISSGSGPAITLAAHTDLAFRQTYGDWIRPGVTTHGSSVTDGYRSATYPFSMVNGVAYLCYAKLRTNANSVTFMGQANGVTTTFNFFAMYSAGVLPGLNFSGTFYPGTITHLDGRFHPFLIVYDPTNQRAKYYSDIDRVTGTWTGAVGDGNTMGIGYLGENSNGSSDYDFVYFAACTGSVAKALSDDGVASAFLRKLGWNVGF